MEVPNPALVKCGPINFLESERSDEQVLSGRRQRPGEELDSVPNPTLDEQNEGTAF